MRVDSTNAVFPKETENSDVASNREKMVEDLGRALEKTRETVAKEREDIMTRHHEIVRKGQEANRKKLLEEKREQELLEDAQTRRERFEAQRENAVRENDVLATTREADAERSRALALDAEQRSLPEGEKEKGVLVSLQRREDEAERNKMELDTAAERLERRQWLG